MKPLRVVILAALLGGSGSAFAHHPFEQEFDASKPVSLTATVASVAWSAPHVTIRADVPDKDGKPQRWTLEAGSPSELAQNGVGRDLLKPGTHVKVQGYLARSEKLTAAARTLQLDDGRELAVGSHDGGPEK